MPQLGMCFAPIPWNDPQHHKTSRAEAVLHETGPLEGVIQKLTPSEAFRREHRGRTYVSGLVHSGATRLNIACSDVLCDAARFRSRQ